MMSRFGYTIFCDDIRNEVGGKLSFIGCYNAVMFVTSPFPLVLPKLCAHLHVLTDVIEPFKSVVARCYLPGEDEPVIEDRIETPDPAEQLELVAKAERQPKEPRYIAVSASLILSPAHIQEPGLIRIRAIVDGASEEMKLGSLRVVQAS
jgi:hypothetical protein